MGLLLDLVYLLTCVVLSPWLAYRWFAGGRDWRARFGWGLGSSVRSSLWVHGSSAGEISLLRPLVTLLERDFPEAPIVISAFTTTGLAAARRIFPQHRILPLPFDISFVVSTFLRRVDPRVLIIVESEFWPNLISAARRRGVPVALVNGKMSEKSFRLHARTGFLRDVLRAFSLLAVQTQEHALRLRELGASEQRIAVTGNMKYDLTHAAASQQEARNLRRALGYAENDVVIIGGSLHTQEDQALLDAYGAALPGSPEVALMVVPRYPADVSAFVREAQTRGYRVVRKTDVDASRDSPPGRDGVLVVDTVGELGKLYAVADIAFVGGSLFFRGSNKGGHNLMEPAILGVPVVFGPYNFSFKETVQDLLAADAACLVHDSKELAAALIMLVRDRSLRHELGARGQRVVHEGQGATKRNYALLKELLRVER